ncbi:MAG: hypothetical protein ACO397_05415 [Gammaproteobacteria bacterium]|jgi:hypothetical protein
MIWIIRLFLFLYAVIYIALGGWAIIEPVRMMISDDFPSFMQAVGLTVASPIGYSEVAGIYGGINVVVGLIALIGVFVRRFAIWASILFMFLTGSIALGRYVLSLIPSAPGFLNNFFIFEVASFFVYSIFLIYLNLQLNKSSKNIETVNSN